jgi:predicted acetyltransferase
MPPPTVTLHPATDADQPTLRRLMQLYCYDFSDMIPMPFSDDALFGDPGYIDEQLGRGHDLYLIRANGRLAGFAIVTRHSLLSPDAGITDMTQFFVIRHWRKKGVGSNAAQQLLNRYPGPWEIRVIDENTVAQAFWREVVTRHTRGNFAESRSDTNVHRGPVFTFTSPKRPA